MKMRRFLLMLFLIIAAAVVGALIASACAGVPALSWLAFSRTIGFNADAPLVVDLGVFKLTFGLTLDVSIAQLIMVALAVIGYNYAKKRLAKP